MESHDNAVYLDLELISDLAKMDSSLFSDLLAGRIAYIDVTPFDRFEIDKIGSQELHWLRGGYPGSILKTDDEESFEWRRNYIRTFLERDIPQLGFSIPAKTLERFWTMLAHNHGQLVNYSSLGNSLGVSHHTIKSYIDILEKTFIIRTLKPYSTNLGKRLVKSPKVYIRDTGLLHALLGIESMNDLLGHPVVGSSFESYCLDGIPCFIAILLVMGPILFWNGPVKKSLLKLDLRLPPKRRRDSGDRSISLSQTKPGSSAR